MATLLLFALVTPIIGGLLLCILNRHFTRFYMVIRTKTILLIIAQGVAFLIRAVFDDSFLIHNESFDQWLEGGIERDDTWLVPLFYFGHLIVEGIPMVAVLFSIKFAVNEKIRAIHFMTAETTTLRTNEARSTLTSNMWTDYRRQGDNRSTEGRVMLSNRKRKFSAKFSDEFEYSSS